MSVKCSSIVRGLVAALSLCGTGVASAAIVTNGDFQADTPIPANPSPADTAASQQPTGWTLTQVPASSGGAPHAFVLGNIYSTGNNVVDFNGYDVSANAILAQNVTTTIGTPYTLSYDVGFVGNNNSSAKLLAEVVGAGNLVLNSDSSPITTAGPTTRTLTFIADATSTTIRFTDQSGGGTGGGISNQDPVLDNVSVTATPEPGSLAVGGAASGLMLLRRRRRQA